MELTTEFIPYVFGGALLLWWLFKGPPLPEHPMKPTLPLGKPVNVDWVGTLNREAPRTGKRYLVVGCGSVGQRVVKALWERGERHIRLFDIAANPFEGHPTYGELEYVRGDVTDAKQVASAFEGGIDVVHSTFAIISYTQRLAHEAALSERVNVGGTKTLLEVMRAQPTPPLLVYTSTSNVVLTKANSWHGVVDTPLFDETAPLVHRGNAVCHYAWSKAEAETLVREAADDKFKTVCVRPCSGVFGPKDGMMLQLLAGRGMIFMTPPASINYIFVDNVVFGHLLAEKHLSAGTPGVSGEAFNVTNGEEVHTLYDLCDLSIAHARCVTDMPVPAPPAYTRSSAPQHFMSFLSRVVELLQIVTRGGVSKSMGELAMVTPTMILVSKSSYAMTDKKARERLGYHAVYTVEEAVVQTVREQLAAAADTKKER